MKTLKLALLLYCITMLACKDAFKPEVSANYKNLLVVEGFINIGGETTIKVGRSLVLLDSRSLAVEKNATIAIIGEDGTIISGTANDRGECILPTQNLSFTVKYKVKIVLEDQKVYETAFLSSKATPNIDRLDFSASDKGFNITLDTNDPNNNTKFYTWDFEETWEVRVPFVSTHEFRNAKVVERDRNINIQRCWARSNSSSILLGSTARLSQDKLTSVPITYIAGNSAKVAYLYSILVKQYGLTKEAYEYLENMKKNTEQIGTIFDPQPSELRGNLTCISNPEEQVIGWISVGKVVQKRIFISDKDKPSTGTNWVYPQNCDVKIVPQDSLIHYVRANKYIVTEEIGKLLPGGPLIYLYTMSDEKCIDCRLNGSNVKPSFWPN